MDKLKTNFTIGFLLLLSFIFIASCDRGKKPYEEAEVLFNQSNYSAAKSKAEEVIKNAPKSKYAPMAQAMAEKIDKADNAMKYFKSFQSLMIYFYYGYYIDNPISLKRNFFSNENQAPIVFSKYVAQRNELFKLSGGRELMELRLKAYLVEIEKALDNFALVVEEFDKAKGSAQNALVEKYKAALRDVTVNYGDPGLWISQSCRRAVLHNDETNPAGGFDVLHKCRIKMLTEKKVDQWMEPNSPSEYADWLSRKMNDYN